MRSVTGTARAQPRSPRRCPACGQRFDAPSNLPCVVCGFTFADDRTTGTDVTPYAKAYSLHEPGWRRMCEWIWYAGSERLKHLMLMRASAASRRFARVNFMLLAIGLALLQTTRMGWHWVTATAAIETTGSTQPAGNGWIHVAAAPRPLPVDQAVEIHVDLWWNPVQAGVATVTAWSVGLLALWLILSLTRWGAEQSHRGPFRGEQRMTAAFHYATAWHLPMVVGAMLVALRPIAYIGTMARWPWCPPDRVFVLSGAVFAGAGVIGWWFWLVRLGASAPAQTRGRILAFFAAGTPLAVAAGGVVWWWGLDRLYHPLFHAIGVSF